MSSVTSTISFGLVTIPVKVSLAASKQKSPLVWISPQGNRVSVEYVDSVTGERLSRDQIRYGVEVAKGKYVPFTNDEIKSLSGDKREVVEIREVIPHLPPHSQVERTYYLSPHYTQKSYRLLLQCLASTKKVAVGKWYTRGKDYIVVIYPTEDKLVMLQLYYMSEVRQLNLSFAEDSRPSSQEAMLATELLDKMSAIVFNAASYQDERALRLKAAVEAKAETTDLATLLQRSLKGRYEGRAKGRKGRVGSRQR